MKTIKLNEEQFQNLIRESIERVMIEEGFLDNISAAFKGAKQGYNAQKSLDKDTHSLKHEWDREDLDKISNPWSKGPENTAAQEANELYRQFAEYRKLANRLLSRRNQIIKQYGLVVDKETKLATDPAKRTPSRAANIAGTIRRNALDVASRPGRDTRPAGRH